MQRRAFLATAAAAASALAAGCTGATGGDPGRDTTTGDRRDTTTDDTTSGTGFPYSFSVGETGPPPAADVTVDAAVVADATEDAPARLEVSFTNDGADAREFVFGSLVPWDAIWAPQTDGGAELLLAPSDGVVPDEPSGDCWRATDGVALPDVERSEELDPGETVTGEFDLLAAHDSDDCHPPGSYESRSENYLDDGWWFTVDVAYEPPGGEA